MNIVKLLFKEKIYRSLETATKTKLKYQGKKVKIIHQI